MQSQIQINTKILGLRKADVDLFLKNLSDEHNKILQKKQQELIQLERNKRQLQKDLSDLKKKQPQVVYEDVPAPGNQRISGETAKSRLNKTVALINQLANQRIESMVQKAQESANKFDEELIRLNREIDEDREKIDSLLQEVLDLIKNNLSKSGEEKIEGSFLPVPDKKSGQEKEKIIELFKGKNQDTIAVPEEVKTSVEKHAESYETAKEAFIQKIEEMISVEYDGSRKGAIMLLQLNEFFMVNYFLNSANGNVLIDLIIQMVAKIRSNVYIERLNYDQLGLIFSGEEEPEEIANYARELLKSIQKDLSWEGKRAELTGNIGIVLYSPNHNDPQMLFNYAGIALFQSREEGKGFFRFVDQELIQQVTFSNELKSDLKRAVENNEMELHYQPQFHAITNEIKGFEALLRWKNEKYKNMSINEVIQLAERENMIDEIGYHLFRKACHFARQVEERAGKRIVVSVNFSPMQIRTYDFMDSVKKIIQETHVSTAYLGIEITESCFVENFDETCSKLAQIKNMGVTVSIDDFGVGYSTLSYLLKMPVSIVKIDKSFLDDLATSSRTKLFLNSIIDITHNLGYDVIAEGVESETQYNMLKEMGCDYFQGYYLARPVPEEKAFEYLKPISRED